MGGGQTLRVHSPDSSTFWREMMSWPPPLKHDAITETQLSKMSDIYLKNIPAKFHTNLI